MMHFSFLFLYIEQRLWFVVGQVYCDRMTYDTEINVLINNIKLQHPVALCRSDFAFCFFAVYVQHWLIFSCRFLFTVTTCFGLTDDG
jgi:hypothetical protein